MPFICLLNVGDSGFHEDSSARVLQEFLRSASLFLNIINTIHKFIVGSSHWFSVGGCHNPNRAIKPIYDFEHKARVILVMTPVTLHARKPSIFLVKIRQ